MREPPFNHFDSTSSDRLSLLSLLTVYISPFSWAGKQNKGNRAQRDPMGALRPPTGPTPWHHDTSPPLTLIPCQGKRHARVTKFHIATRLWRIFSLLFWKYFSVHSPCYFFAISATWPGHTTPLGMWREQHDASRIKESSSIQMMTRLVVRLCPLFNGVGGGNKRRH